MLKRGATLGQGFDSPHLHQIKIIRTFIQSEMGSDLLYMSRKLKNADTNA